MTYDEITNTYGHTPVARRVGRLLHSRGHYEETPDAFEWWLGDAAMVASALDGADDPRWAVRSALLDTGLHDPTDPTEVACLDRDVEALLSGEPDQ